MVTRIGGTARMSSVVIHGQTVYTQGLTARDAGDDIASQTAACLAKLDGLLADAGCERSDLVKVMIWLKSMEDFAAMNDVYDGWVHPDGRPVRACVQSALAHPSILIEIQAEAALPSDA